MYNRRMSLERWSERIWIDRLPPEPMLGDELELLQGLIRDRYPGPDIILNLSRVDIIHSTNLSRLLKLREMVLEHSARLRLVGPSDSLWTIFMTTGLDRTFDFSSDIATALAQLQIPAE
jgi:anti-anti-sigma factor